MDQDDADMWRDIQDNRRLKKAENLVKSLKLLEDAGIALDKLSDTHYRRGYWDYWPSTGKFRNRVTKEDGRGVFNFIKICQAEG